MGIGSSEETETSRAKSERDGRRAELWIDGVSLLSEASAQ